MQKRLLLLFVFVLAFLAAQAQLPTVFTQYYFNELVINPAYAGADVQTSSTITYRNQWINFPGSPKTMSFTSHTSLVKGKVGVGLMVNVDKIGSYRNSDVSLFYSYKLKFPNSTLSFGLQGTLYFLNADYSALSLIDPTDISFASLSNFKPNIGAGIYYHKKNFFAGFSVPSLINSTFSGALDSTLLKQLRNYFVRTGYIHELNKNLKVNPSVLIRAQEGQPLSVDFNALFIFYDVFSAGFSYRTGDAVIGLVGIKLLDNLYFNYSYDFTGSNLYPYSSGTHELMLNYRAKINAIHKELNCPTYHTYRE